MQVLLLIFELRLKYNSYLTVLVETKVIIVEENICDYTNEQRPILFQM